MKLSLISHWNILIILLKTITLGNALYGPTNATITSMFDDINLELDRLNKFTAQLEWRMLIEPDGETVRLSRSLSELRNEWKNRWCEKLMNYEKEWTNDDYFKGFVVLCRGPRYDSHLMRSLITVRNKLSTIYSSSEVCRIENDEEKCFRGEPDLAELLTTSRNEEELRWAWTSWRDKISGMKDIYVDLVNIQNLAARKSGYSDIGECWREELDHPSLEKFIDKIYSRIKPLYRSLHAVVRFSLAKIYPEHVDLRKPIPAHLLGNLWAQSWNSLIDLIMPNYTSFVPDLTQSMRHKNYTVRTMIEKADEFFTSLGLPPLTEEFWRNSVFEKNNTMNCHATAANMFTKNDFRILACLKPDAENFHTIYHELGHIQYFMAYQNQPTIFKNGVNSAFHEAVGDSLGYSALGVQHLSRLGLLNATSRSSYDTLELFVLLRQALMKIPFLVNGLIMEKWRWSVFRSETSPGNYNKFWWKLHHDFAGISPPSSRSENSFDPGAQFHVANDASYASYILASILDLQLYQSMCESAVTGKVGDWNFSLPLYRCDIYGSEAAGENLLSLMKLGSSEGWRNALREATGRSDYLIEPFLKYYEPVNNWLKDKIKQENIFVGWD